MTNEAWRITDRYSYDAYGNLLEKEGDTENEFLYTGEQYNANTVISTGMEIDDHNFEKLLIDCKFVRSTEQEALINITKETIYKEGVYGDANRFRYGQYDNRIVNFVAFNSIMSSGGDF